MSKEKKLKPLIVYDKCYFCGETAKPMKSLKDINDYYEDDDRLVCNDCLNDNEIFDTCSFCSGIFLIKDLVYKNGLLVCKEHKDELDIDDEERSGIEDYIDYINKD